MLEFRPTKTASPRWLWLFVGMIALAVLAAFVPLGRALVGRANLAYELAPTGVVIHYGSDRIDIAHQAITNAWFLPEPTGGRRLFGTGMPGLHQGRYTFRETGPIILYASTLDQLVIIETANGKWGITPADPERFLAALKTAQVATWAPVQGASPWWFVVPTMGLTLALLGGAVAILIYYIRLPQSIRYGLTDEGVLIEGGRLHLTVPYGEITAADYTSPKGGPLRTFGAQVPGLIWGRFRWKAAGPNLRLYATQTKPLILIATPVATYGITPEDGERFLTELKKRIGGEE